ncbi:hypothetical protein BY458DRAFT_492280 [Sporodiniella umbellata]|nr:hypothetical protein BY458DRAFT_492280 [Sporodiniella umbellata]
MFKTLQSISMKVCSQTQLLTTAGSNCSSDRCISTRLSDTRLISISTVETDPMNIEKDKITKAKRLGFGDTILAKMVLLSVYYQDNSRYYKSNRLVATCEFKLGL